MAEIIILGAGIVGVSTALSLQERGHDVIILDRVDPGQETSFGNAGLIQREAAKPYAMPRDLPTLIAYGLGHTNDVVYKLADLPRQLPALWSYFRNSGQRKHGAISAIYSQLIATSTDDHAPLAKASNAEHLIRQDGFYTLCRDARMFDKQSEEARHLQSSYEVPMRIISGDELRQAEPALKADAKISGAVHWTGTWSTSDPGALTAAYAKLFIERGGQIVKGDASTLCQTETGWIVGGPEGDYSATDIVVALGPWSPDLLKTMDYKIPMVWKRGYHSHFQMETPLNNPVQDIANGVVLAPMARGLRIATGAELVRRDAPMNPKQLMHGLKSARQLMPVGEEVRDNRWIGHRPCMPDMLPMVGKAPRHKGLWFHFGHGHQGLTLGPTTARLLADIMDGQSNMMTKALSPMRLAPTNR